MTGDGAPPGPSGATGVAGIARLLARAGLVEAFGHVSARDGAGGFLLTSTAPLGGQDPDDVHRLDADGRSADAVQGIPLEAPLHAAIYAARPDVQAVCRTHSRAAVAWTARRHLPPLVHGLGALAGRLARHEERDLVVDAAAGAAAAAALDDADCLLLAANGALATGPSLSRAAVRAWYLEERCRVALDAEPAAAPLGELGPRARHLEAETIRAWRWLHDTYADVTCTLTEEE